MKSYFRRIPISRKIPVTVAVLVAIPIFLTILAIRSSSEINNGGKEIYDNYFVSVVNLTDARKYTYEEFLWLKSHIISPDDQAMREAERRIADAHGNLQQAMTRFGETLDAGEETRIFNQFKAEINQLRNIRQRIIALSQNNDDEQADAIANSEYQKLFLVVQAQVEQMFKTNVAGAKELYQSNQHTYDSATSYFVVILVVALLIALFFGWVLISTILRPLVSASTDINDIAKHKDLTRQLPIEGNDELTQLSQVFNMMLGDLREVIVEISQSLKVLSSESHLLMETTSVSAEQLASSSTMLSEVQLSTSEITQSIDDIAKNAVQASGEAEQCANESKRGMAVQEKTIDSVESLKVKMNSASDAIGGLSHDSDSIGSVLDVIRGIAEQTNLLALNAAIEAARAGEQGRGFAVVADEVRTLAQRTQESTSEIQATIEKLQAGAHSTVEAMQDSLNSLDTTVKLTHESKEALNSIESTIGNITLMNDQIASATEEQSVAVKEINTNVAEASSLSQQSAEAFASLQNSSNKLLDVVGHFEPLLKKFNH